MRKRAFIQSAFPHTESPITSASVIAVQVITAVYTMTELSLLQETLLTAHPLQATIQSLHISLNKLKLQGSTPCSSFYLPTNISTPLSSTEIMP